MKKSLLRAVALCGITLVAACGTPNIPDQKYFDMCRETVGIDTKFIVVTSPTGERSLETDPPGTKLPLEEAIAFDNCLRAVS